MRRICSRRFGVDAGSPLLRVRRVTRTDDGEILAVTTDHGHIDAGGHGGGSALERRSFLTLGRFGGSDPLPTGPVAPHEVRDLLLADRALAG
jgi:hypothetical protein